VLNNENISKTGDEHSGVLLKHTRRFYWLSLAILLVLSAYPLINGMRMVYLSIMNGVIKPEQYAKYVVPYAAMCFSIILFAALQPLICRIKRVPFLIGLIGTIAVFTGIEQFFERMQIKTAGMTLVDPSSLNAGSAINVPPSAAVDVWQASLCAVSPLTRRQSAAYVYLDRYFYVMANDTYKIHYYLISFVLIAMVCGLVYGIAQMIRSGDRNKKKPLILQGIATAALVALCLFANTTGFFRQAEAIQTPLASILTCLFFTASGSAAGIYTGSFLLSKNGRLGLGLPVLVSSLSVLGLYIGEAAMMEGGLYRFGAGWFFDGLPGIALAPVDIIVVSFSAVVTGLVLNLTRRWRNWPGKRTIAVIILLCALISGTGIIVSTPALLPIVGPVSTPASVTVAGPASTMSSVSDTEAASMPVSVPPISVPEAKSGEDLFGCYEFDECIYMNPLSSFIAVKGFMPYVYGMNEDALVIANTETGEMQRFSAQYENIAVDGDEFTSKSKLKLISLPDISRYKERWLRARFAGGGGIEYGLYQMDGEIWLVSMGSKDIGVWSIYRLQRTDIYDLSELKQAFDSQTGTAAGKIQMTLRDVYELARKGRDIGPGDLERSIGKAAGPGFDIMRYDIEGGCVLIVHSDAPDSGINYARLTKQGYDPFDEALSVDIRDGTQAVAAYLDPLHSLRKLKIEDKHGGAWGRELIYEFESYRYFLNTTRADEIFITFENGERLPLKQALEERRTVVEELVSNGLFNVFMEPAENPMGGFFTILHHHHKFSFDGEAFYPSATFMYSIDRELSTYFDIEELADILELQGRTELAGRLRSIGDAGNLPVIAGRAYIDGGGLAKAGIKVEIGWHLSSHTPVSFRSENDQED
jgi:hypothetical protein